MRIERTKFLPRYTKGPIKANNPTVGDDIMTMPICYCVVGKRICCCQKKMDSRPTFLL